MIGRILWKYVLGCVLTAVLAVAPMAGSAEAAKRSASPLPSMGPLKTWVGPKGGSTGP